MKKKILFLFVIIISSCSNSKMMGVKIIKKSPLDTIVYLSQNRFLFYTGYSKELEMYSRVYLMNNKGDTIHRFVEENEYRNTEFDLSPNKRFLMFHYIYYIEFPDKELFHNSMKVVGNDTVYVFDRAYCDLIDIRNGEDINTYQSACGGEWNSKNQWIYGGDTIFVPKK